MTMTTRSARWMILPVAALSLSACGINSVPTKEEAAKAKWANVENEYQRRVDLYPNIEALVKGAMNQEKSVFVGVAEARSKASSIQLTGDDLKDAAKVEQYQQAQDQYGSALSRLLVTVEQYPNLVSPKNVETAQIQIEGTENRVSRAREEYNGAVQDYNTTIRTFPDIIGAKIVHGAEPMVPFKAVTKGADEAPKMNLGQ